MREKSFKKTQKKKLKDEKEVCLKVKPEESFASNMMNKNVDTGVQNCLIHLPWTQYQLLRLFGE